MFYKLTGKFPVYAIEFTNIPISKKTLSNIPSLLFYLTNTKIHRITGRKISCTYDIPLSRKILTLKSPILLHETNFVFLSNRIKT